MDYNNNLDILSLQLQKGRLWKRPRLFKRKFILIGEEGGESRGELLRANYKGFLYSSKRRKKGSEKEE